MACHHGQPPVLAHPLGRLWGLTATIRRCRAGDRAAVYQVCVETADAGRGVRGRYSTDDLVPDTVAGPYLFLDPRHAYVLDDGGRAVGRPFPGRVHPQSAQVRSARDLTPRSIWRDMTKSAGITASR